MNTEKLMELLMSISLFYFGACAILFPVALYLYAGAPLGAVVIICGAEWPIGGMTIALGIDLWRDFRKG